MDNGGAVLLRD